MADTEPLPYLLTTEQLAEHLGVTQRHVRRLVAEKRVPYVKWRRFIRFDPAEIAAWLDSAREPQAGRNARSPPWPQRLSPSNCSPLTPMFQRTSTPAGIGQLHCTWCAALA
jgi:excisionase family DNA binding protein